MAITTLLVFGLLLPNPIFDAPCTGTSYGIPFPVKIVHCLCEKGTIEYIPIGAIADITVALLFIWIFIRKRRKDPA